MDALNTLRAILVGIAAHFGLWAWLRADKRRDAEADPLAGVTRP